MAIAQNTYSESIARGAPGMLANSELANVISATVETAAGIGFGQPAYRGSLDRTAVAGAAFAATAAATAAAGNTGAATITASPPAAAPAKQGRYTLTAVSAGATAAFLMTDPTGTPLGEATTGTPATIGGIGPFTITDAGTDPAVGDQFYIDVTYTANGKFLGIALLTAAVGPSVSLPDGYGQYAEGAFETLGPIWVTAGAAVAAGTPVYWNPATKRYTANSAHVAIPDGIYDTSTTADGQLVKVILKLR